MLQVYRKRKRGPSAKQLMYYKRNGSTMYRAPSTRRHFIPGKDRVSGYYGRFGADEELKFHDFPVNVNLIASSGSITATLIDINQGTGESERIGRKCTMKSMDIRFNIFLPEHFEQADVGPGGDILRYIVYVDKQCNGAAAVGTDILESSALLSHRNLANSERFVFLCDKLFTLNRTNLTVDDSGTAAYSSTGLWKGNHIHKTMNVPIEYSGVTGAIAEIRSNNIGHLLLSMNARMSIQSVYRFRFSDK